MDSDQRPRPRKKPRKPPTSARRRRSDPEANPLGDALSGDYRQLLHRYLLRRAPAQDIDDVIQEAFLRFMELSPTVVVRDPTKYIYRIACNVVRETIRRQRTHEIPLDPPDLRILADQIQATFADAERLVTQDQIERILLSLEPLHRTIFLLRNRDGLAREQIAEQLQISPHTVKKYLYEAIAHIKASMG